MGFPPDRWDHVPVLASVWGTLAVVRLAEQIRARFGISEDEALARAAVQVGIPDETIRTRLRRSLEYAYSP